MTESFPTIETPRLTLRQPNKADAGGLLRALQDEAVLRYFGMEPLQTRQDALDEIAWFNRLAAESKGLWWIITKKGQGQYLGDLGFFKYEKKHARVEVGYKLLPVHWGQGFATEALRHVVAHGFATMGLNRIEALVDPRNTASLRLLGKLGFAKEGLLREYEFERGAPVDLAMLSLLKREWSATASV